MERDQVAAERMPGTREGGVRPAVRRLPFVLMIALAACLHGCAALLSDDAVRGSAPSYLDAPSLDVPNADAMRHRIWTPALDEGYVPQGLTSAEGDVLYVSSYKPASEVKAGAGPCQVFRIDTHSGAITGRFGLAPDHCNHAGGLAYVGNGRLLLADTRQILLIDLSRALAAGSSEGATRMLKLGGALRGSYATFDGRDLWIGTWTKEAEKARMYRLASNLFDAMDGRTITEAQALESIPVPVRAQGAAFDRNGQLWLSASDSRWARLYRIDRQGKVLAEYPMVPGLEDLAVDDAGRLWGLSESGARRYLHWAVRFPFVFQIDTARLRVAP